MSEFRLEMDNISKSFPGVRALNNVSIKVRPGSIHALMGENGAGKSTLMKCLFGINKLDAGSIKLDGVTTEIVNEKSALSHGISMIHQELHPIPFRSVMENIWLGRFPKKGLIVDQSAMHKNTIDLLAEVEMDISPSELAGNLSVSKLQGIEIAKAISFNSRIIIMDEPTSSLTETEVAHLFKLMRRERDKGTSIIYISHKMEEILEISDEVTIMRDGTYVGTWESKDLTTDLIISRMVGRDITDRFPAGDYTPQDENLLEVKNFTSINPRSFKDVNFCVKKGEILGIGGLVGAQRTELVESIFGLRALKSGTILRGDKEVSIKCSADAIANKIALLTEERRVTGIIGPLSIMENTVLANQKAYAKFGVLNDKQRISDSKIEFERLKVKAPSIKTPIKDLSGGNQQKVLISRWLLTQPDILILDEPTRGIDVGAKYEIYLIMRKLAKSGKSIIMISSEMPELLGMSDRIMVMCEGNVSGILDKDNATDTEIMRLATMFK